MKKFPEAYVTQADVSHCRVCGNEEDLRMGCCFDCSDHVDGEAITSRLHKLWDRHDPSNVWYFGEPLA